MCRAIYGIGLIVIHVHVYAYTRVTKAGSGDVRIAMFALLMYHGSSSEACVIIELIISEAILVTTCPCLLKNQIMPQQAVSKVFIQISTVYHCYHLYSYLRSISLL